MSFLAFSLSHHHLQGAQRSLSSTCVAWYPRHHALTVPHRLHPINGSTLFRMCAGSQGDRNLDHESSSRTGPQTPSSTGTKHTAETDASEQKTDSENNTRNDNSTELMYEVSTLRTVTALSREEWDRCAVGGCASPFMRYDWIRCLEKSGCASLDTGWTPYHIVLRNKRTSAILAIAPAYVKVHSLGEFVFDQDWADAAYGAGINYYPKLLLAVPFTPATGRRILTPQDTSPALREKIILLFGDILVQLCSALRISSVHVNFCSDDEAAALSSKQFLMRKGVQYHFTNYRKGQAALSLFEDRLAQPDFDATAHTFDATDTKSRQPYVDFEDYLNEFKSKKRIKMRRERQVVREESGLRIEVVRGDDIDRRLFSEMFDIYKSTIDKKFYGRQYLNRDFFNMLYDTPLQFRQNICLVLARAKEDGRLVGGTFNIIGGGDRSAFYGRYWGCHEEFRYLHFEACYYTAIEYCIEQGLSRMEPGAGGGDFKYMRGFEPAITLSMHYLRDERLSDAIARYLRVESLHIDGAVVEMKNESAIRSKGSSS